MATRFQLARGSVVLGAIARGPSGTAATITAGATTTSAEGTSAAVSNSGSSSAATFDFTIPRGAVPAIGFNFDTSTTDADPGAGDVRFNHATPASVTEIYFDNADRDGNTVTGWLDAMDDSTSTSKGHIVITPAASPDDKLVYSVSGTVVDGTGYRKVTVAHVAGTTLPSSGAHLAFEFSRTGDKGADGSGTFPGSSTDNAVARFDGTGGTTVQNSIVLIDDSGNICPVTTDTGGLGTSSLNWADLFLDSGAVINFDSGDVTLTHSANDLALAGGTFTLPNTGLHILDTNASHDLIIAPGSDLTGDHTLTLTTGDADRTLTISGNATVSQDYSTSGNPQFATIELGAASDTTVARVSAGIISVEGVTVAMLGVEDQTLAGGARVTSKSLGTVTTGTVTPDPGDRPMQHYTNNGAHTLAPGTNRGSYYLDIVNDSSAGSITKSGWTKETGASFTTTNTHKFRCYCSVGEQGSSIHVEAFQ